MTQQTSLLWRLAISLRNFCLDIVEIFSLGFLKFDLNRKQKRIPVFNSKLQRIKTDETNGSNSNSSDSENGCYDNSRLSDEFDEFRGRKFGLRNFAGDEKAQLIANEAVSHSYEDITRPDYLNHLWLASKWDRSDICSEFYFLLNWTNQFLVDSKLFSIENSTEPSKFQAALSFVVPQKTVCESFMNFIYRLSSIPDSFYPKKRITMPKKLKTLVLDLDETLIHSTASGCSNFDFMVEVLVNRTSCLYYVFKRPHLDYFLSVVGNWYNLVIYTASVREYADPVIDLIDDNRRYFKKRLFRHECIQTPSYHYLKDLSHVDQDISKICLLDNSAASFAAYPDNAIPIESWKDRKDDSALLDLLPFLDALRFVEDVRSVLSLRRLVLFCNK